MYKQIEEYVRSLTAEERDKMLTGALCDIAINALGVPFTIDEVKEYVSNNFDSSEAHIKNQDEEKEKSSQEEANETSPN